MQRRDNRESSENICDSSTQSMSLMCHTCLSQIYSNHCCTPSSTPQNLCQDFKNELHSEKVSEFCRKFEEKSGYLHQVDCEEQMEESLDDKNCNDNAKIPECRESNIPEMKSVFKNNETDEEECIDPYEDDECIDYDKDYKHLTCKATDNIFKSREICKCDEVECNQKQKIHTNSLMEVGTNTSYQKVSCSKKNLSIQKKISTSLNKKKLISAKDSGHNFTDIALKSQDQFQSKGENVFNGKPCISLDCECHRKNRKKGSCNCKVKSTDKECEVEVRSSRNNSFHYKEISFFDGWNNVKNALGSYFQNRISPISSKPGERLRSECQSHTPSNRREFRKMNLNEKEKKDAGTKNTQPKGGLWLIMANTNRLDFFPNSEKNCSRIKRSKTESKASNKELDKMKKYNNDKISAKSDCTISRFSDRAFIDIQPENNVDLILDINMQLEDDTHDNTKISRSGKKTDSFFLDDSTVIINEDKINSVVDAINDNLSESASNECLVHPGKDNFTSECKFRRNDNNGRDGSKEFKHKINVHSCCASEFDEIKKKETIAGSKHRKNLFQGIKFTTTKVQMN